MAPGTINTTQPPVKNATPATMQKMAAAVRDPHSAMRALTKSSLYRFLKYLWPQYTEDKFSPNWHIEYLCAELEKIAYRVANKTPNPHDTIINVPPGSTKTAVCSIFFPLWCWVNWYWMRFITVSYTAPLSLESAEYSREVVRSEAFRNLFPEIEIKEDKDTKSNFKVIKREWTRVNKQPRIKQGGNRFSTSVGGSVTGFHGHIIIVDDPIDPTRVLSETEVKKANHWMDNTLPFRKTDKKVTSTVLIMQRLHQADPTGHWIKTKPDRVNHICIPGEIRNYRDKVRPPELIKYYKNELMDPTRLDWHVLGDILALGQYTYGGQIGQDPVPLGGGMFQVDHIAVLPTNPIANIGTVVRYWDKAGTEGDGAYTVGVKMARTTDGTYIVMDVKRGQWSSNVRERIIRETAQADGTDCFIYVEQEPGSGGKESAENTIKNLAGFSAYADRPTGDKALRADPYSVQVNNGNVQMVQAKWNAPYVDELENFPNSTYKDQVDASSGAFAKLSAKKMVRIFNR